VEESEIVQLARFTTRALSACLYLLCQPSVAIKGTVLPDPETTIVAAIGDARSRCLKHDMNLSPHLSTN
jgi:hypothetical protein